MYTVQMCLNKLKKKYFRYKSQYFFYFSGHTQSDIPRALCTMLFTRYNQFYDVDARKKN